MPDFTLRDEGSLFLLRPNTDEAVMWCESFVEPEAQWFGGALVVEPRYVEAIALGIVADGLEIEEG